MAITAKAAQMKAAGEDVISLGAGEPDFATPKLVCDAAEAAIRAGKTKYTNVGGTPELKQAVVAKFKRENHITYSPSQVTVASGAKQLIYNCFQVTLNRGDEVIMAAPYWVSYPAMVVLAEGKPIAIQSPTLKLSPELVEQHLTERTKWIILNSPSNPSGAVYTPEELKAFGGLLKQYPHIHILSDDIYEHLTYEGKFATMAELLPQFKDRILTINGVSKAYAMTGWRIGYGGGSEELIKAMEKLQSQSSSNASSVSQAAAVAALEGPQGFLAERRAKFKARRDMATERLNGSPLLSCHPPQGAFYLFVQCHLENTKLTTDLEYADYLLTEAKVAVVAGSAFGCSPYFRLSYALEDSLLEEASTRIINATAKLA